MQLHQPRFYPVPEKYLLPHDAPEAGRLNEQHSLLRRLYDNRIIISPVVLGAHSQVLDIATGSGAWALDLISEIHEINTVYAADIGSKLFPKAHPSNIQFVIASVLEMPAEWTNKFQLVHQRLLLGALKYDEWTIAVSEIFRVTTPGGWAELCECTPYLAGCGPYSRKYVDGSRKLANHFQMDFDISKRLARLLSEAGFVDVQLEFKSVQFGPTGGKDWRRMAHTLSGVARGFGTPLMAAGGLGVVTSQKEWEKIVDEAEKEWESEAGSSAEYPWFIFTAKKPLE